MSVWDSTIAFLLLIVFTVTGVAMASATMITTNMIIANNVLTGAGLHNYLYVIGIIPQMDYVFVFVYLGVNLAILVRAAYLNAGWESYVIAWIASFVIVFISFYISNIFVAVFQAQALASGVAWFSKSIYIVRYFPVFNAVFLGLYSVVILLRLRQSQELSFSSGY
jgi:hypothetical protein